MALSVLDIQKKILLEVGAGLEGLPDPVQAAVYDKLTPFIGLYWDAWAGRTYYPGLQELYVKRQCLKVLAGQWRDLINVSIEGISVPQAGIFANIMKLIDDVEKDVAKLEKEAQQNRQPALGTIASEAQMDASGRLYNPYKPRVRSTDLNSW